MIIVNWITDFFTLFIVAKLALTALSGIFLKKALVFAGQQWVENYHNTMTYFLLPTIGFAITTAISNNIALSLGMIGALSIVRFRHPVKSPFELIMFFALLTVGITMTVNAQISLYLVFFIVTVIVTAKIHSDKKLKKGVNVYRLSFNEGQSLHVLEVSTKKPINDFSNKDELIYVRESRDSLQFYYKFVFVTKEELNTFMAQFDSNPDVTKIEKTFH